MNKTILIVVLLVVVVAMAGTGVFVYTQVMGKEAPREEKMGPIRGDGRNHRQCFPSYQPLYQS